MPPQNLIEKIAQRFAVGLEAGHVVRAGDYLSIRPAYVMTHDNSGAVIPKFRSIGASKIANQYQPVFALDHDIQNQSPENLAKYAKIEAFAREMGIDFYPAGRGIGHQIMCEEGYAWPGTMVVASDSHSNMYGGLGCLGTPIVRTDAAAIWATGRTWWQVPPVAKVELTGKLSPGITGKDVIITLCGFFNKDEVLNFAIEFCGEGLSALPLEQRLTIANMTTEWGALVGLFPIDEITIDWLNKRADFIAKRGLARVASDKDAGGIHPRINQKRISELEIERLRADHDASYAKELVLELALVLVDRALMGGDGEGQAHRAGGHARRQRLRAGDELAGPGLPVLRFLDQRPRIGAAELHQEEAARAVRIVRRRAVHRAHMVDRD